VLPVTHSALCPVFMPRTECWLLCCLVLVAGAAADSTDKSQGTAKAGIHLLRVQNVTTALHGPSTDASEGSVGEVLLLGPGVACTCVGGVL
jgi:hypothetical protein